MRRFACFVKTFLRDRFFLIIDMGIGKTNNSQRMAGCQSIIALNKKQENRRSTIQLNPTQPLQKKQSFTLHGSNWRTNATSNLALLSCQMFSLLK